MAIASELLVQVGHLPVRYTDDVFKGCAMILQARMFNHVRCAATGRIELILIQAPAPGSCDGKVINRVMAGVSALDGLQHVLCMVVDQGRLHYSCSPLGVELGSVCSLYEKIATSALGTE